MPGCCPSCMHQLGCQSDVACVVRKCSGYLAMRVPKHTNTYTCTDAPTGACAELFSPARRLLQPITAPSGSADVLTPRATLCKLSMSGCSRPGQVLGGSMSAARLTLNAMWDWLLLTPWNTGRWYLSLCPIRMMLLWRLWWEWHDGLGGPSSKYRWSLSFCASLEGLLWLHSIVKRT